MKNQGIILLLLAGIGAYFVFGNKPKAQTQSSLEPAPEPVIPIVLKQNANSTKPTSKTNLSNTNTPRPTVNNDLLLKKGSKGLEVKELQKLLGFKIPDPNFSYAPSVKLADGDFGPNTEKELYAQRGVKQITLNLFRTTVNTSWNPRYNVSNIF